MKKVVLILIILWILPLSVQAADLVFDKGITWGMSQKEVLKLEKKADSKVKDKSAGIVEVEVSYRRHKNVRLTYVFVNNELDAAAYMIRYPATVSNAQIYYNDYLDIVADLTDTYGKPKTDELRWKISESTLKSSFEDQSKIGLAVSLGYLDALTIWEVENHMLVITVELVSADSLKAAIKVSYKKLP